MDISELEKKWQALTIQDNFIFGKTMENNPDLCRRLLEKILRIKIKAISYPEREKVLETRTDSKGIRLDVYVEDKDGNRSFDVEMQVSDSDNLAKRMRYYQGLIDMDKLKHGQHYSALGESFIIFICPFDRFKEGRHIYTFKELCAENSSIQLGDGATKIFLSTKGTLNDVDEDVKAFLEYVDSGIVSGDFVIELDEAVQIVKTNRKAVKEFMTFEMILMENRMAGHAEGLLKGRAEGLLEGRAEGLMEGRAKGLMEGRAEERTNLALKMLHKGKSFEEIHEFTELSIERIKKLADSIK